jgi:hypothetical protein
VAPSVSRLEGPRSVQESGRGLILGGCPLWKPRTWVLACRYHHGKRPGNPSNFAISTPSVSATISWFTSILH